MPQRNRTSNLLVSAAKGIANALGLRAPNNANGLPFRNGADGNAAASSEQQNIHASSKLKREPTRRGRDERTKYSALDESTQDSSLVPETSQSKPCVNIKQEQLSAAQDELKSSNAISSASSTAHSDHKSAPSLGGQSPTPTVTR